MHRSAKNWGRAVALLAGAVLLVLNSPTWPVHAESEDGGKDFEPVHRVTRKKSDLRIVEKFSKIVETENKIKRVDGFDPSVVKVTALEPNQIRVQALTPGVTSLLLTDEKGESYTIETFVAGDVRHLQAYIKQLFPDAAVEAVKVRDSVVLRGWVTDPDQITEIVEIAEQFYPKVINQMKLGGVQQVLLKVKVMEVQRSKLRRLGFNFEYLTDDGFLISNPGDLQDLATVSFGIINGDNAFDGFIDALKQEQLLKILAEPELVVMNGRPANLLSGGEFPILVPQGLGTVAIEYKEFGVSLDAVPIILGNGRLRLELTPEVSERDFTNAVDVSGFTIPGLTTRRANTQVEMKFGQTLMLAGLISNRKTAQTDKLPILGEMPWVGGLFRRMRYEENETELVILVTPEFVGAMDPGQVPPGGPGLHTATPTDRELYIDGMIEVPNYGDPCVGCEVPPVGGAAGMPLPPHPPGLIGPEGMPGDMFPPPGTVPPGSASPPFPPGTDPKAGIQRPQSMQSSGMKPGSNNFKRRRFENSAGNGKQRGETTSSGSRSRQPGQKGPRIDGNGKTIETGKSQPGLIRPSTTKLPDPNSPEFKLPKGY